MGLLDAAGAAHHGGDAGVFEQPGFSAKSHQRGASLAAQPLGQAGDGVVLAAQKAGDLADGLKAKTCVWRHLLHRGLQRLGIGQHFRLHLGGVGRGQVAEFVAEFGVARHHVVGNATVELADAGGGKGHVKAFKAGLVLLKALGHVAHATHHAGRHFNRVDRVWGQRRVRLFAAHAALVAVHPLVGNGGHHERGLTHNAGQRLDAGVAQVGNQLFHTKAAHFLVVAEGEVHRERGLAVQEGFCVGQGQADEGLHVSTATAIELAVLYQRAQRVHAPVLPRPGHGVGVARKNDAAGLALAQRGKQVGLGLIGVVGEAAFHAQLGQGVAHKVDQLQVRVLADGVHADQGLCKFEGVG